MATNVKVDMKLQGHEKFALRDGWLNKGLMMVKRDPMAFQGKNGPDIFGIGNNMVKSLRYWLKAFGLIEEKPGKGATLTELGELILKYDPYFEDVFTVWILHSMIARNIKEATTWFMFFNKVDITDLDKEHIEDLLLREIRKYAAGAKFSENSVKNDLDVILNMYGKTKENVDPEDKSVSPLAALNLVKNIDGAYTKLHPAKKIISEWTVLYELMKTLDGKEFISIEDAVDGECGLGRVLQLSSVMANEFLDRLEALDYIRINRTAGLDVIYKLTDLKANEVIEYYYTNVR